MHFFLVVGKNKFYIYTRSEGGQLVPEYIDGNPFWEYTPHAIKSDLKKLMNALADGNNLDDINEIKFSVVKNADRVRNVNVISALTDYLQDEISLEEILQTAIKKLSDNPALHIAEFGVNYDGDSYVLKNGNLEKNSYSLLAYTISQEEFVAGILGR